MKNVHALSFTRYVWFETWYYRFDWYKSTGPIEFKKIMPESCIWFLSRNELHASRQTPGMWTDLLIHSSLRNFANFIYVLRFEKMTLKLFEILKICCTLCGDQLCRVVDRWLCVPENWILHQFSNQFLSSASHRIFSQKKIFLIFFSLFWKFISSIIFPAG